MVPAIPDNKKDFVFIIYKIWLQPNLIKYMNYQSFLTFQEESKNCFKQKKHLINKVLCRFINLENYKFSASLNPWMY